MKKIENEMIYHGCSKRNIGGTNRLIKKGEVCLKPTKNRFGWNHRMF